MTSAKLKPYHVFTIMIVFLLGTSIIYGTPKLVPDTWLVDLVTLLPATLLFCFYALLLAKGQHHDLFSLLVKAWGRIVGRIFVLGYTVYFLYIAARNVRDMTELVTTSLLRFTPNPIIVALFVLIVAYTSAGGLFAIGRLSVLIATMVLFFFVVMAVLLVASDSVDMERLLPFLSHGFAEVWLASLTSTIWFPYGELIVFLVFFPTLGNLRQFRRTGLAALWSAGLILTLSDILLTTTLGMENIQFSVFALLDAARMINIANFITRMDALVALIIMFGVLLKCSVFLYAGCKGAALVFRIQAHNVHLPASLLIGAFSILIASNGAEHYKEGLKIVMYALHMPLQLVLPFLTLLLVWIRYRRGGTS
ncbi:GerAB/ArcD/ProY family transporter [Paenibacillus sp. LHD-117]|uniref:GerAB/ArcD/ProY family transporter n=1 Tax=Paenibacillus sp. LHD-117 TaxID=3071412 RepID=UPI0027DF2286|nr:GerAB/ArcD/ProY family transporter [Paenibacillus sp. LHD-117]MDQ6419096.1 GerAB/ArcD/ProY family transporter [Paenibacillus sp. LHD-117]